MEEKLIEFSTAKLAKEKGFNEPCNYHYSYGEHDKSEPNEVYIGGFIDDNLVSRKYRNSELANWSLPYGEFTAPTQSLLAKWLREVHGIHVNVHWSVGFDVYVKTEPLRIINKREKFYDSYEEALEIGLIIALNIIQ